MSRPSFDTFEDLYTYVAEQVGSQGQIDRAKWWVNAAYLDLCSENGGEWCFMEETDTISLVDGTSSYSLPTRFHREVPNSVFVSGADTPLIKTSIWDWEKQGWGSDTSEAEPTHYCIFDNAFLPHPIPDTSYTVYMRYFIFPDEMTTSTDVAVIPKLFIPLLLDMALLRAKQFDNQYDLIISWLHKDKNDRIDKMKAWSNERMMEAHPALQRNFSDYPNDITPRH